MFSRVKCLIFIVLGGSFILLSCDGESSQMQSPRPVAAPIFPSEIEYQGQVLDRLVCFRDYCGTTADIENRIVEQTRTFSPQLSAAFQMLRSVDAVDYSAEELYNFYGGGEKFFSLYANEDGTLSLYETVSAGDAFNLISIEEIRPLYKENSYGEQELSSFLFLLNSCRTLQLKGAQCERLSVTARLRSWQ